MNLEPLISTLSCLEGDEIDLGVEGPYLLLTSGQRRIRTPTFSPSHTGTQVDPGFVTRCMAKIPDDAWQGFGADVAKGVVQAIRGLGAHEVNVQVGPGGMTIIVGDHMSVEFEVPMVTSDTPYGVFVPADQLRSVLAEVGESRPAIALVGVTHGIVGLRFEEIDAAPRYTQVTYVLSQMRGTGGSDGSIPNWREGCIPFDLGSRAVLPTQMSPPSSREKDPRADVAS